MHIHVYLHTHTHMNIHVCYMRVCVRERFFRAKPNFQLLYLSDLSISSLVCIEIYVNKLSALNPVKINQVFQNLVWDYYLYSEKPKKRLNSFLDLVCFFGKFLKQISY